MRAMGDGTAFRLLDIGRFAIGRPAGYWVWDASLLDALRAIGYWILDIGYWTPCGLLAMGRFAIGYWRWAMGDGRLDAP